MQSAEVAPSDPDIINSKTKIKNVDVRIYDPVARGKDGSVGPLLVYIHGGGWVLSDIDIYDLSTYHLSKALPNFLVVSIDYRRAPEHVFPTPLEDIDAVYRGIIEHAADYRIDRNRIAIAGDSAGGNLAAAYCLKLRDANRRDPENAVPMPKLQALLYPALQAVDLKTTSFQSYDPLLSKTMMAAFWTVYLTGSEEGHEQLLQNAHHVDPKVRDAASRFVNHALIPKSLVSSSYSAPKPVSGSSSYLPAGLAAKLDVLGSNSYLSPLIAEDLTELPSAYIVACEYDVLRDDSLLYGRRLEAAGVKTQVHLVKGGWHGMTIRLHALEFKKGNEVMDELFAYIRNVL